jgi:ribosome biogenesis GTPase / thiamine phosphate phosphatase
MQEGVETEHMLIGILRVEASLAAQILIAMGVRPGPIQEQLAKAPSPKYQSKTRTSALHGADTSAVIQEVLPRRSKFVRKSPGKKMKEQVIAANVDMALLVSALDGDFNPRRVERYLAQCWESGAKPLIVLNKADACEEARARAAELERVAIGTGVCVVSARTGQGFGELEEFLRPGETLVLLGSSGVGKSTIANRLLGQAVQAVRPVRASDSRGRHTTTSRELFVLPAGALLIDTPGLREMQLWDAEQGVAQTFWGY